MTLALLWRFRAVIGWTLAVCLALTLWYANNAHQQEVGVMREKARQSNEQIARLTHAIHDTDTLYQRDTVVVKRVIQRWDTLYTERQIHDTAWVVRALDTADSVKRACVRVLADCNVLLAQKDTLIRQLQVRVSDQTILSKPSTYGLALKLIGAVGVGVVIGKHF